MHGKLGEGPVVAGVKNSDEGRRGIKSGSRQARKGRIKLRS